MSLSRRLRNIAKTQLNALKERLDRVDAEEDIDLADKRARREAVEELTDPSDIRMPRRTPEEIATGIPTSRSREQPPRTTTAGSSAATASQSPTGPLTIHYRRLGLEEGADMAAIQAAYDSFAARCAPDRFADGSEDQKTAGEIFRRVEESYKALREELDATAGRFDKLEL